MYLEDLYSQSAFEYKWIALELIVLHKHKNYLLLTDTPYVADGSFFIWNNEKNELEGKSNSLEEIADKWLKVTGDSLYSAGRKIYEQRGRSMVSDYSSLKEY